MEAPRAQTYGGLLREMARRFPDRPAISFEGAETTFQELDVRVDAVARGMLALGVRHGDVVSVLSGNRPEWLEVAMAAARIGAVTVPLNTFYQTSELEYQLSHAEVKVLFTVDRLLKHDYIERLCEIAPSLRTDAGTTIQDLKLPALRHVVQLDGRTLPSALDVDQLVAMGEADAPDLAAAEALVDPEDVVFILYTSGSTARPKAVVLHHGPALKNDFNIGERQHMETEDRVWLATPLFYAFGAVNAMPNAWTHGACLVLQETFDAGKALEIIEREKATVYYGQPHITRALINHPDFAHRDISTLKKGVAGHNAMDKHLAIEVLGVTNCCSMYGLTEVYGHFCVTDAFDPLEVKLHTQGRPLPDWEYKILDPDDQTPLPAGEAGELWVRGYVTSGYYKQPDVTAEVFDDEGFFRTGDLIKIDDAGRVQFQSRLKEIIKVGGINVTPVEIEELLLSHDQIRQAYVVGVPDVVRGGEVIAAFVDRTVDTLTDTDVREHVRQIAARFKVPTHVFFRTESQLPRGVTGKVPKTALLDEALRELAQ